MTFASLHVAGISFMPPPWIPPVGEEFEGRLRSSPRWFRMIWKGWSRIDPSQAVVECLEIGPRSWDTLAEMRPLAMVRV